MKLVVAIGNPGLRYRWTRHNIGFLLADRLANGYHGKEFKEAPKLFSSVTKITAFGEDWVLLKPSTYVNLSGSAVVAAKKYYNLTPEQILVLADDVNRPFGVLRMRQYAGSGGHNGIKSITASLGSNAYWQLRLGVGYPAQGELSDFVLSTFSGEEKDQMESIFDKAIEMMLQWNSDS